MDARLEAREGIAVKDGTLLGATSCELAWGRAPSDYLKQAAQAAALGVLGVEKLRNDLEVVADEQWRQESSAS
jgi:hypothetical protein